MYITKDGKNNRIPQIGDLVTSCWEFRETDCINTRQCNGKHKLLIYKVTDVVKENRVEGGYLVWAVNKNNEQLFKTGLCSTWFRYLEPSETSGIRPTFTNRINQIEIY